MGRKPYVAYGTLSVWHGNGCCGTAVACLASWPWGASRMGDTYGTLSLSGMETAAGTGVACALGRKPHMWHTVPVHSLCLESRVWSGMIPWSMETRLLRYGGGMLGAQAPCVLCDIRSGVPYMVHGHGLRIRRPAPGIPKKKFGLSHSRSFTASLEARWRALS